MTVTKSSRNHFVINSCWHLTHLVVKEYCNRHIPVHIVKCLVSKGHKAKYLRSSLSFSQFPINVPNWQEYTWSWMVRRKRSLNWKAHGYCCMTCHTASTNCVKTGDVSRLSGVFRKPQRSVNLWPKDSHSFSIKACHIQQNRYHLFSCLIYKFYQNEKSQLLISKGVLVHAFIFLKIRNHKNVHAIFISFSLKIDLKLSKKG